MLTIEQFEATWQGKFNDFDGALGPQCMDLVEQYNKDVINAPRLFGNAVALANNPQADYYDYIKNTPLYIPPKGAIAVWNKNVGGGNGHCAIVLSANLLTFTSLDQNWPTGTVVHEQLHNYFNVDGFLVAKANRPDLPTPSANPDLDAFKVRVRNVLQSAENILDTLK